MENFTRHLTGLGEFVHYRSMIKNPKARETTLYLISSFSKSFHFAQYANMHLSGANACFNVGALRCICEELIFLAYAYVLPPNTRNEFVKFFRETEQQKLIRIQDDYLSRFRPYQLKISRQDPSLDANDKLLEIFVAFGFPNATRTPSIEQLSAYISSHKGLALDSVYGLVYRMTSMGLHFSPHMLTRFMGVDQTSYPTDQIAGYNPHLKEDYYLKLVRTFSCLLFCLYFELFGNALKPDERTKHQVKALRKSVMSTVRWPEPITYEELNLNFGVELDPDLPNFLELMHIYQSSLADAVASIGILKLSEDVKQKSEMSVAKEGMEYLHSHSDNSHFAKLLESDAYQAFLKTKQASDRDE